MREHEICVDFLEVSNARTCKFEVVRIYANSSIVFAHVSIVPKWLCCFQGMKPSGLCFAGMLIHFRSGKFQVLDLSTF